MVEAIVTALLTQGNLISVVLLGGIVVAWRELSKRNDDLKDLTRLQEENMKEVTKVLNKCVTLIEVIKDYVLTHDNKRSEK